MKKNELAKRIYYKHYQTICHAKSHAKSHDGKCPIMWIGSDDCHKCEHNQGFSSSETWVDCARQTVKPERIFTFDSGHAVDLDVVNYISIPEIKGCRLSLKIGTADNKARSGESYVLLEEITPEMDVDTRNSIIVYLLMQHGGPEGTYEELEKQYPEENISEINEIFDQNCHSMSDDIFEQFCFHDFKYNCDKFREAWKEWRSSKNPSPGTHNLTKEIEMSKEKEALSRALRALCLTRDYVGEKMLPPKEGWEWYDAGKVIAEIIPDDEWAEQFRIRAGLVVSPLDALKKALTDDPEYAWSWHCNIAMASHDEGLSKPEANRAAARFMKNCFDIDMTKHEHFKDTQMLSKELAPETETQESSEEACKEMVSSLEVAEACLKANGREESPSAFEVSLVTEAEKNRDLLYDKLMSHISFYLPALNTFHGREKIATEYKRIMASLNRKTLL